MAIITTRLLTGPCGWLRVLIYLTLASLQLLEPSGAQMKLEKIDAYKQDVCGWARFRPWQPLQSAFGCLKQRYRETVMMQSTSRSHLRQEGPLFSEGLAALDGELPFFAQVKVWTEQTVDWPFECGGTLIHSDLVLTSASCVAGATGIGARFGNNERDTYDREHRSADRVCIANGYNLSRPAYNDLALVRLESWKLLPYDEFKIAPACLALLDRHTDSTLCSMTGVGRDLDPTFGYKWKAMIQPVQRLCNEKSIQGHSSCYLTTGKFDESCPYLGGSPIVCYDKCGTRKHRAYVVGVISKFFKDQCVKGKRVPLLATDLNWKRQSLLELIYAIRQDNQEEPVKGIKCWEVD